MNNHQYLRKSSPSSKVNQKKQNSNLPYQSNGFWNQKDNTSHVWKGSDYVSEKSISDREKEGISGRSESVECPNFVGLSAKLRGDSGQESKLIQAKVKDNVNESEVQPENQTPTPWVPEFKGLSAKLWGEEGQVSEPIQAKLTIGQPNDKYEQEADRVASQVVKEINAPATSQPNLEQSVQRTEEREEENIQRKTIDHRREPIGGGEASTDLASAINSARGGGQPLDTGLQQSMGLAMGADFSGVRVHTDTRSDQLNQSIQAKAFTTGQDVFFRTGEYEPGSRGGQKLIAHELTHVLQQRGRLGKKEKTQIKTTESDPRVAQCETYENLKYNIHGNDQQEVRTRIWGYDKHKLEPEGYYQEISDEYENNVIKLFDVSRWPKDIMYAIDNPKSYYEKIMQTSVEVATLNNLWQKDNNHADTYIANVLLYGTMPVIWSDPLSIKIVLQRDTVGIGYQLHGFPKGNQNSPNRVEVSYEQASN
ncbi:MAG: DUF4157 domain-containing protein [Okeania sp. SIO2D1]|nr:DUF4157 domain-containing protein [Okeania sp. SIO2D1]